jgi:hypothetical protein
LLGVCEIEQPSKFLSYIHCTCLMCTCVLWCGWTVCECAYFLFDAHSLLLGYRAWHLNTVKKILQLAPIPSLFSQSTWVQPGFLRPVPILSSSSIVGF